MDLSIIDIAKEAGVSKSTVSRVINDGPVNSKTRERVLATMEKMGYSPNFMARGLRGIKSPVIGVLSMGSQMFTIPTIYVPFSAIVDVLKKHDYDLLLVHEDFEKYSEGHTPKPIAYLREHRIDGLITLGYSELAVTRQASEMFRNVVYAGDRINPDKGFRIYQGNYHYSRDVYSLLMENGHSRIMTVSYGMADRERLVNNRKKALRAAAKKNDIALQEDLDDSFINPHDEDARGQDEAVQALFEAYKKGGYTAVYVDDYHSAQQITRFFSAQDYEPGRDYSIITVDRLGLSTAEQEKVLSCVCLSDYDYGYELAHLMIEVIQNPELEKKDVIMPYTIEHKKSVVRLRP